MADLQTKLIALMEKAQPTFAQIERLPQIETFVARTTVQIWRRFVGGSDIESAALKAELKDLGYKAGCLGENLLRITFQLDDFQGNDIRTLRKQKVIELQEWMKKTDIIRSAALRWVQFLEKLSKRHLPGFEARAAARKRSREKAEKERKEEEARELAERKQTEVRTQVREQHSAGAQATRWRPNISHKEYQQGVRVFVELPGFRMEDVQIESNHRTLLLRGNKNGVSFAENLSVSQKFDFDQTTIDFDNGFLLITLFYSRAYVRESRFSYL